MVHDCVVVLAMVLMRYRAWDAPWWKISRGHSFPANTEQIHIFSRFSQLLV